MNFSIETDGHRRVHVDVFTKDSSGWGRGRVDHDKCRASISNGSRSMSWHQCGNTYKGDKAKGEDGKLYGFCGVHHPDTVRKRDAKRDARWDAESKAQGRVYTRGNLRNQIADMAIAMVETEEILSPPMIALVRKLKELDS